jgi:hypothetical protein
MKKLLVLLAITLYGYDIKEELKLIKILQNYNTAYIPIKSLYNPFNPKNKIKTKPKQKKIIVIPQTQHNYILQAIFQNKAKINNIWYKNGDKIDKYTIIIKNNKVFLKNKNKLLLINRKPQLKVK